LNILKVFTVATSEPNRFLVYWTNSSVCLKGIIQARVTANIEDRAIAAELSATKYLLEQKCVLGQNQAGNAGIRLSVSSGAIRKLMHRKSNKGHLAPYAQFLSTRFAGCQIDVDKDRRWFDGFAPSSVEDLLVSGPAQETIRVHGIGEVCVTRHIVDRFAERFLPAIAHDKRSQVAWRKLVELAGDPDVYEVSNENAWTRIKHSDRGQQESRYFLNPNMKRIFVVTDNPRLGRHLVTTYAASHHFMRQSKAA
jgi:hypothetical protein